MSNLDKNAWAAEDGSQERSFLTTLAGWALMAILPVGYLAPVLHGNGAHPST